MDPVRPRATALAVLGGRIVAVGEGDELHRHLDAERVVNVQGRAVVPGFHDAHNHMPSFGLGLADIPLSSPPVGSVEDILRAVKARAAARPAGTWIIGGGYDQNKLAERRHPRAAELDAVAPDHLVWLRHNSGHMCVVGGRVLDAIGIDGVPVPEGGVVERDASGRPTGLLQEQAQALVHALVIAEIGDGMLAALGPERSPWCYRRGTFLEAGLLVPGSSDRPVVNGAPLLGIHDMVNQRTASGRPFNPAEALTAEQQAIRCYTLHSARAAFREAGLGSLEPAMLADFAVLSADPTTIPPETIAGVEVLATVVGGRVAHDRMGLC
jgi:predicted amidohydrolase YtcJ